jgi:hypothetical protein
VTAGGVMKVTAATITDAQIREIRDTAHTGDGDPEFVVRVCERALRKLPPGEGVYSARARCAAIWNVRHGGRS